MKRKRFTEEQIIRILQEAEVGAGQIAGRYGTVQVPRPGAPR